MPTNSNVTDEQLKAALDEALAVARRKCPHGEAADVAGDAAVDGVLYAYQKFDPANGTWTHFVRRVVSLFISRGLTRFRETERRRPEHFALGEYDHLQARTPPTTGGVPMSVELRDLPDELRDMVRLYLIDGYTMEEVGLLCGLSKATVRTRLIDAARELNPGVTPRARAAGAKRLASGGRGR